MRCVLVIATFALVAVTSALPQDGARNREYILNQRALWLCTDRSLV